MARRTRLATLKPRVAIADLRTIKPGPKRAEDFYHSAAWKVLVAEVKRERGERCQDCGRTDTRIHGDHVVELKDGGARLDKANVRLRCSACHGRKTADARAARLARW